MHQPDANADDPSRGRRPATNPFPDNFAPDRRVIEGSSTELADETRDLLHHRLRAASLMLALGFGIFLLRDLYFPKVLQNLIYLHGLVFLLLVVNILTLSGRWTPSMRQLRLLELATFGIVAGFFVASQSFGLHARVQKDLLTAAELRVLFKNSIIGTLILMLTLWDLHSQQLAQGDPGDRTHGAGAAGRPLAPGADLSVVSLCFRRGAHAR